MDIIRTVSVIIPTVASTERADLLDRAINSILNQQKVRAIPIIIANGAKCDPEVLLKLSKRKDLRYAYLEVGPNPKALSFGRSMVDTPYFAVLDDDDILTPHAMITRIIGMETDPKIDVVVTNGVLRYPDHDEINITDFHEIQLNPLKKLLEKNWMLTGSALFRTESVTKNIYDEMPMWFEWTYLALRLCAENRKILFINNPTIIHHISYYDFSIDRSNEATLKRPEALVKLLNLLELPGYVRIFYEKYLGDLYRAASFVQLNKDNYSSAWDLHKKALRCRGGLKYLPHTLQFITNKLKKAEINL